MFRLSPGLRHLPRFAPILCVAGAFLLPIGCHLPMSALANNGPPVPGPLSSAATPPLSLAPAAPTDEASSTASSAAKPPPVIRTSHQEGDADNAIAPKEVVVDVDTVLRLARERNPQILLARERVNESQAAFDVAVNSCMPDFLRKDTFKRANAEARLWQQRAELSKVQTEVLQESANTYFDWLTARRGEAIARELEKDEEKLLKRAESFVDAKERTAQVLVEATKTALSGRRQFIAKVHQQGEAAAVKLAYLLGMGENVLAPADATLSPIDMVDASVPPGILVRQSLENGPGVRELLGLAGAIQTGIEDAHCARCLCDWTGANGVCGRLRIAQSKLRQAQLALADLHGKLRAGVEEARSAILAGREQIAQGLSSIQHANETYRMMNLRLQSEGIQDSKTRNTHTVVLTTIQHLSQAHASYLSAINAYNKAQVRLLLLLGTHSGCQPIVH